MESGIIYEVISRVAMNEKIIGFMVKSLNKKSENLFMSLEVINFGLSSGSFKIKNVKLGNNGKPRGYNGFLLSKLPIISIDDNDKEMKNKIYQLLSFIVVNMGVDKDIRNDIEVVKIGIDLKGSLKLVLPEYIDMNIDVANKELDKTIKFYLKALPDDLKKFYKTVKGVVEDKGVIILTVTHSMVKEE